LTEDEVKMSKQPDFGLNAAHRFFAADCYNKAWDLLDKTERTPEEDEQMIRLTLASHWHWTQRPDYSAEKASIGYWQTSRVFAVLGQAENARRFGQLCLDASQGADVPPFCLAYAYEALARAEAVAGNHVQAADYITHAQRVAERMSDFETKQQLTADLAAISRG
jgi:hypothetical protein